MIKKVIALLIVLSLVFVFCLTPVSAAEENITSIDVLDYSTLNGSGANYGYLTPSDNFNAYFSLPFSSVLLYADIIVEVTGGCDGISFLGSTGNTSSLTLKNLGTSSAGGSTSSAITYRAYGALSVRYGSSKFGFRLISSSTSRQFVTVVKFEVYLFQGTSVPDRGEIFTAQTSSPPPGWLTQPGPGGATGHNLYYWSRPGYADYTVDYSSVNWRNFDYIDFNIMLRVATIQTITCRIRSSSDSSVFYSVPFEFSFLNGESIGPNTWCANGEFVSDAQQLASQTEFNVILRLYIPRQYVNEGSLILSVSGIYSMERSDSLVSIQNVTGYYSVHDYDPSLIKLDQIETAIKNSLSSSAAQNAAASQSNQNLTASQTKADAGSATLNSMNKPSINDMGFTDPNLIVNKDGVNLLVQMISPLYENELILALMLAAAALAHLSYCYFGRR